MDHTLAAAISAQIREAIESDAELIAPYVQPSNSVEKLMAEFSLAGVKQRGYLEPSELTTIALVKNGGKLSEKTRNALNSNSDGVVKRLTQLALEENDPELAIRFLLGLDGVRLPTASCILAWTMPDKWPVIDVRAWGAICQFSEGRLESPPVGGLKISHWIIYNEIVQDVAQKIKWRPQCVDVWLYAYDKKG